MSFPEVPAYSNRSAARELLPLVGLVEDSSRLLNRLLPVPPWLSLAHPGRSQPSPRLGNDSTIWEGDKRNLGVFC